MSEIVRAKLRVAGIDFAPVIVSDATLAAAVWVEQPLTLKDDEVSLVEGEPTEDPVYTHELDTPVDVDYVGALSTFVGTFIKATFDQMVTLMGGVASGAGDTAVYKHSGVKKIHNTAIRIRLKDGGAVIIPKARGTVQYSGTFGAENGRLKLPFKFTPVVQADYVASTGEPIDFIIQNKAAV